MPKWKPFRLLAALVMLAALSVTGTADAAGFNQYVGFGASTLDSGYFHYNSTGGTAPHHTRSNSINGSPSRSPWATLARLSAMG